MVMYTCKMQTQMYTSITVMTVIISEFHGPFQLINTSPPSAAYMRQWTGSALVQVMACRLLGAKPLPKPMLIYCQLGPWQQTTVKFESK